MARQKELHDSQNQVQKSRTTATDANKPPDVKRSNNGILQDESILEVSRTEDDWTTVDSSDLVLFPTYHTVRYLAS